MFEYQGWITVRATFRNADDLDDVPLPEGFEVALAQRIKTLNHPPNMAAEVLVQNGALRLVLLGNRNRATSVMPSVAALYELIADTAPGSYGEFSFIDWDVSAAEYWVLQKGTLSRMEHPHFSPLQSNIEHELED